MKIESVKQLLTVGTKSTLSHNNERVEVRIVKIGPAIARELLNRRHRARPVRSAHIEAMTKAMKDGRWLCPAQPIFIDRRGVLIEGHHRMHAVVRSGTEQYFMLGVVNEKYGKEMFMVLDATAPRSMGDTLTMYANPANSAMRAAIIGHVVLYARTERMVGGSSQSKANRNDICRNNDKLGNARLLQATRFANRIRPIMGASVGGAIYTVASLYDKELAEEFITGIINGGTNRDEPVHVVREALIRSREIGNRVRSISTFVQSCMVIKAWNHWLQGETPTRITFNPVRERLPVMKTVEGEKIDVSRFN